MNVRSWLQRNPSPQEETAFHTKISQFLVVGPERKAGSAEIPSSAVFHSVSLVGFTSQW